MQYKSLVAFSFAGFATILLTGCSSISRFATNTAQSSFVSFNNTTSTYRDGQIDLKLKFTLDMIPPTRCKSALKLAYRSYDVDTSERDYGDIYSKNFDLCSKSNEVTFGYPKQIFRDSNEGYITAWLWNDQAEKFKRDNTTGLYFAEPFRLSIKCENSVCTLLNNGEPVTDPTFKVKVQSAWNDVLSPKGWNSEEISAWAQLGIDEFSPYQAAEWKKSGFAPQDVKKYFDMGITTPESAKRVTKACDDKISSPPYYEFPPKSCFMLYAKAIQIFEAENSGLYGFDCNRAGECNTVYMTFGTDTPKARVPDIFRGIAKPNGNYTYTTLYGRTKTIPRLKAIR